MVYRQGLRINHCFFALVIWLVFNMVPRVEANQLVDGITIPNFGVVSGELYRGAQPSMYDLAQLEKCGVKTIIDLRRPDHPETREANAAAKLGLKYIPLPLGYGAPSKEQVSNFLKIVNDPANQPVFVHCRYGADRTGTMVAIFRMTVQGWSFKNAYAEMRVHHFKPFLLGMKRAVQSCTNQATLGT
jgi:uncharacterized protein (TIGR01244 family)